MTTSISDTGLQLASGNIVDLRTAIPVTGTYTGGDVIIESTGNGRVSGWKRQTTGSGNVLGTDWVYFSSGMLSSGTVATTSGTSIPFTGIPSWVRRVTLGFNGVSTNGSSTIVLQIGSGSIQNTGYTSIRIGVAGSSSFSGNSTIGFYIGGGGAATTLSGTQVITLGTANSYVSSGTFGESTAGTGSMNGGSVSLSGVMDRMTLTTTSGTDTFDAGSISVLYE